MGGVVGGFVGGVVGGFVGGVVGGFVGGVVGGGVDEPPPSDVGGGAFERVGLLPHAVIDTQMLARTLSQRRELVFMCAW